MVCFHTSIAACKSTEQSSIRAKPSAAAMSNSVGSTEASFKPRQISHLQKNRRILNSSIPQSCNPSQSAPMDVVILIAVIGAFGFLVYPYVMFTYVKATEIGGLAMSVMMEEILENPVIYGSLGISMIFMTAAVWTILICTSRRCGNPNCRGLRQAAEFQIELETEESVKNTDLRLLVKNGVKRGLFELPRDHHRELEAELKRMAPPNGRAVLMLKGRCGCAVGRMEVAGARRPQKIKK